MVCRGMALLTGRGKVCQTVCPVPFPVTDMVYMEDSPVLYGTPAETAGMSVPQEYGSPEGIRAIAFPLLVSFPFRYGFPLRYGFQGLCVKFPHLEAGGGHRDNPAEFPEQPHLDLHLVEEGRRQPFFVALLGLLLPVVKPGLPVPFTVPPCPAVLLPVIVMFRFILQKVTLFA